MFNMLKNFTKRQWYTLIIIGLADFCNAICVSLQAPFFPQEVSHNIHNFSILNKRKNRIIIKDENVPEVTKKHLCGTNMKQESK